MRKLHKVYAIIYSFICTNINDIYIYIDLPAVV